MKIISLLLGSALLSSVDPGCGASAGSDLANAPDGGANSASGGGGAGGAGGGGGAGGAGSTTSTPSSAEACEGSSHTFCEDFSGASMPGHFDSEDLFAGTVKIDSRAVTAPSALLAATTPVTSGTRSFGRLKKAFTQSGQHFTLAYSEWIDSTCIGQNDNIESGVIGLRQNSYWIAIRHGASSDSILESGIAANSLVQAHVLRQSLRRDGWVRVSLDVDLATNTIDLLADGTKIVEAEPLKAPPSGAQTPSIEVGVLNDNIISPPSACTVSIDDVAFDITP